MRNAYAFTLLLVTSVGCFASDTTDEASGVDEAQSALREGEHVELENGGQRVDVSRPGEGHGAAVKPSESKRPIAERGATLPYVEYEAESGSTDGVILTRGRKSGGIAAESSGRRAVRLEASGQSVGFQTSQAANSIVVRYAIPDSESGGGIDATLGLYVNGVRRQSLQLTSAYAWTYGGETGALSNDPAEGEARQFYDEARAFTGDIPAGATVQLKKDADDTASYYVIDLIDLEQVESPLPRPVDSLSIVDFGAIAGDKLDDGPAIQSAIDAARSQRKTVWIPAGTFLSTSAQLSVADVTIAGAGMWYSTVKGRFASFDCTGGSCRYHDFAVLGEAAQRPADDASSDNGFNGGAGKGSMLENIWVEHTKYGYWVANRPTDGLIISGSRFRNLVAGGVHFDKGTSNSVIEQSHARNTGDDGFASWDPSADGGVNTNNVFRFNTVQAPRQASCYAFYGGKGNKVENSVCDDNSGRIEAP